MEDRCVDKTSAVLNKWYVELKKSLSEDYKIKTGCGEHLLFTFVVCNSYEARFRG